jgi:hypothetical protein
VFTYVYSRYALCLLLQIFLVAALDIKTRDVPSVSSINWLLSQYFKALHFFCKFLCTGGGGGGGQPFALPRVSHGQRPALDINPLEQNHNSGTKMLNSQQGSFVQILRVCGIYGE